ncbi:acyltransferase family protein [Microbacterium esteraromaticum]|nr:acyltransferase [Microbacterium esteraromaticum]
MTSLGAAFNPKQNSLNALRLLFATAVIVAHAWPLSGRTDEPIGPGAFNSLGPWAVAGFFVISGYLIAGSRDHSAIAPFLWRRFLRIYPAFVVVLAATAFVFAPLSTLVMGEFSITAGVEYLLKNAGLYIFTFDVNGTLPTAPYPDAWNGSLWTLFYEALCYVGIGLAMTVIPRRWLALALSITVIGGMAVTAAHVYLDVLHVNVILHTIRLGTYFAAGALLYVLRERVAYRWEFAAVSAVAVVITAATGTFDILAAVPLAYLCMWLGIALPLDRVGAKNDISYGMYIYAFPVQQLLAITIGERMPLWLFMLLSIAATVPFAWASWVLVERPAMRLRGRGKQTPQIPAPSLAATT